MQCSHCRRQTSITAGTIFHGHRLPLLKLFKLIWKLVLEPASSADSLAKELGMHFSSVWTWEQKIRLLMPAAAGETAHFSCLEPILFRRSIESPSICRKDGDGLAQISQEKSPSVEKLDVVSATSSQANPALAFISQVFGGVSRKYLQIYLSQFQNELHTQKGSHSFRDFLSKCMRSAPITRLNIREFYSDSLIILPLP